MVRIRRAGLIVEGTLTRLPCPDDLGPDPEPLGVRAELICPLAFAVGRSAACNEAHCAWFRVPGTIRACAVEQWAPQAARDVRVARWFATRGEAIVAGRAALNGRRSR